jgi:CheY-like chemotaxis protein
MLARVAARASEQVKALATPAAPVPVSVPVSPVSKMPAPVPTGGIDVLVAEDNEVNRIVFSQILEAAGIGFNIVNNGAEAVEAYCRQRPTIVIMDVSMPVMNGLQATIEIRRLEADTGERIPIIGVTAHALDGDREMCMTAGMDDYMTKPISPERLEEKIRRWTGRELPNVSASGRW